MSRPVLALFLFPVLFAQDLVFQGLQQLKSQQYKEAVATLRAAVQQDPNNAQAHIYLASSYMGQLIPASTSPENQQLKALAEAEFREALRIDPNNTAAIGTLAMIAFQSADFEQADHLSRRLTELRPQAPAAYNMLGRIAWARVNPAVSEARISMGMQPQDPGPLRNGALRLELREKYLTVIDTGLADLQNALRINPADPEALTHMSLLLRLRADLADSMEAYTADRARSDSAQQRAAATTPQMNPPGVNAQRIRVGGNVQAANLVAKPDPVYPPLARQARIQGTVRYSVVISQEGVPTNIQLVSGHPLLIPSATEAIRNYRYKPTLLNGHPVEVLTSVDVNFVLEQ